MNALNFLMLLGGVALFLFGMSLMGDGLKKVAGNKLELILYKLSGTPFKGLVLGTGVTAVIQSSSATSVMVVGFVNSEMMKLRQAIPIIMGAIIGTSITGWIICLSEIGGTSGALSLLSTDAICALAAIAGILLKMAAKKKTSKNIGDILLGFSVLMFGMKTMSGAVSPLKESEKFLTAMVGFKNPILGILIGAAFTAVLQSASAAVGILQALASTGAITFEVALPIILGISIGASVPVLVSAAGASSDGKRTAFSYLVVEVLRTILFAVVFYGVNAFVKFDFVRDPLNMVGISTLNTIYRLSTVIVLLPFISLIEKIVKKLVKEQEEKSEVRRLEQRFLNYPALAVEQSKIVIQSMAQQSLQSLLTSIDLMDDFSEKGLEEVNRQEKDIDKFEDKLGSYLSQISGHDMTEEQNFSVNQYLRAITDLERMSDHAVNIAESAQEIREKNVQFTEDGEREIRTLTEAVREILLLAVNCFIENNVETAYMVEPLEQVIDGLVKQIKVNHISRLQKGLCTINNGYILNDLLTNFSRVSDHCSNIAGLVLEPGTGDMNMHETLSAMKHDHANNFDEHFEAYAAKYRI